MWCEKCQADVAAQASRDNQRLSCTSCGTELKAPSSASTVTSLPSPRNPRELLARWAQEDAADPFIVVPGRDPAVKQRTADKDLGADRIQPALRFDAPHPSSVQGTVPSENRPRQHAAGVPLDPPPNSPPPLPPGYLWHGPHSLPAPHFQPQPVVPDKPTHWMALTAQIVSYLGVGTLTIGAALVLMGHFGGHANYAPMGWLVTTAGQMLLFLGVVTLISCGMEQTTHEVARRVESLGDKLLRVEHAAAWTAARLHAASAESPAGHPGSAASGLTEQQIRDQIASLTRQLERQQ